jgi:hypothetical protein
MTVLLLLTLNDDIEAHSVLRYFKGRGYEADLARSGRECAAKLRDLAPEVFARNPERFGPSPEPDGDGAAAGDGVAAPFLFILGDATGGDVATLTSTANARYLEPPLQLRTLLDTVRSLQAHARTLTPERPSC